MTKFRPTGWIEKVLNDKSYEHVARFDRHVWPGYLVVHVVRHVASGSFWAKDVHMDDDSSREIGDWYQVARKERVVVDYEPMR